MRKILLLIALLGFGVQAIANTCGIKQAGSTDQTVYLVVLDEATGVPTAGLAYDSSGIDLEYVRTGAAAVDITEATQTANGAHADGGFVSVGHGRYRLDLPDAAVAAGVSEVIVQGTITGYVFAPCTVSLSPPVNTVALAGTAQTGRDIGASVLLSSGTGTGQLSITSGVVSANATQISGDSGAADALEAAFDGTAGAVSPLGIVDQGTAQSATSTTLVLRSALAIADDAANGMTIVACGSTQGYCQSRVVTDYTSSSDTATVDAWTVTPSGTITYYLFGTAPVSGGGSVTIAAGGITSSSFASGAITADAIAADAIGASEIAADAIGSSEIAADAIGASEIAANAIGASEVADGAIDAGAIANNAIDAATFAPDVDAEILSYIVDDATRIDASALNTATGTSIPAILVDTGTTLQGELDGLESAVGDIPTNAELTSALNALAAAGVYSLGYRNGDGDECVMVISESDPKLDVTCTEAE
jgi:hypothetical protein